MRELLHMLVAHCTSHSLHGMGCTEYLVNAILVLRILLELHYAVVKRLQMLLGLIQKYAQIL